MSDKYSNSIKKTTEEVGKTYRFNTDHDPRELAQYWFQESHEGVILFLVFYTQACRWSRCLGCNLPSMVSQEHVPYDCIMAQVDRVIEICESYEKPDSIKKIIVSNNGSVLDEETFSSTALVYLISQLNLHLKGVTIVSIETRPEYVDMAELEFMSRTLKEGNLDTALEICIGFECFDDHIRNDIFDKGLKLQQVEQLVEKLSHYNGFKLKCYFMLKPVPDEFMDEERAIEDISKASEFLSRLSSSYGVEINMHLNPTYVAHGTKLEEAFLKGLYTPPTMESIVKAVMVTKSYNITVFVGLSDEGLAIEGGSFLRVGDDYAVEILERFNRTQDYSLLEKIEDGTLVR